MRLILKLSAFLILLPSLFLAILYKLNQEHFFDIQEIEMVIDHQEQGQKRFYIPLSQQLQVSLNQFKGTSLVEISISQLNNTLQEIDWIENFHIQRVWPRKLKVSVYPEKVEMLVVKKTGGFVPILESGKVLKEITSEFAPDVVLIHDEEVITNAVLRKKALAFLVEVPREGSFSLSAISEFKFDPREGFVAKLLRDGTLVKLGEEQIALKAARVGKVVEYLQSKQFQARVIDANLSKKVLVRLRKDP
jgi:cell division protein FtsQ